MPNYFSLIYIMKNKKMNKNNNINNNKNLLTNNEFLHNEQFLKSNNNKYKIIMQNDGNLVLYDENNTAHWSTGTYNKGE